ncbi:MAG: VOC family protein, partial [Sphingorhabdus sp.]
MFSHIMLGATDLEASKAFYDATLGALGHGAGSADPKGRVFWFTAGGVFSISVPIDGNPATCANGSTIGFAA